MSIKLNLEAGMSSNDRGAWPTDPKAYERLELPAHLHTFDPRRKDFVQTAWVRPGKGMPPEQKSYPRWYALLEMDEYRKQPDPVETRWQKFVRWVRRQPRPVASEPPRVRVFFSLSKMQVQLLREFLQEEYA